MNNTCLPGSLVNFVTAKKKLLLDGFLFHGKKRHDILAIYVHGMWSNFYRTSLIQELAEECQSIGVDVLSFNNQGSDAGVNYESFVDCLEDIDAALLFGRRLGYRRFVLVGHSTGCQKIVFYQSKRQQEGVQALVLLGPVDDNAICRRDIGRLGYWLEKAKRLVRLGRGRELLASCYGFSAKRFLSIADTHNVEANIFNYDGPLTHFRRIAVPQLVVFSSEDEYTCIPLARMREILEARQRSSLFEFALVRGGDHFFKGFERTAARRVATWLKKLM